MMGEPMPCAENHTFDYDTATSPTNFSSEEKCDCNYYSQMGRACPCSVNFAAKTGKRAVERILHKSIFFQDENVLANVELQTEAEAASGDWKSAVANHVIQVEACHVEVGEMLGKGGFCLVHDADIMPQEGQNDRPREKHDYCVKFLKPNILLERRKFARGKCFLQS